MLEKEIYMGMGACHITGKMRKGRKVNKALNSVFLNIKHCF